MEGPSAANACLPEGSPVVACVPPVPQCKRGVRCPIDAKAGRCNSSRPVVAYASGKLVVARTLGVAGGGTGGGGGGEEVPVLPDINGKLGSLCYRGHSSNGANVTACKFSASGCYVASGDEKGGLKVWAFDHPEHLTKLDNSSMLQGAVRDVDWDSESKRLVVVGERVSSQGECAKAVQWDTGVTAGTLSQFSKGRVASCAFKPSRPFRIVTSGMDEAKCYFHQGPPFAKVPSKDNVPAEAAHALRGGVQCVRYSGKGSLAATVASDKALCLYDGKTFELLAKVDGVHDATVYCVAWSGDDAQLLTSSGDGTCKLFDVSADGKSVKEVHRWDVAKSQAGGRASDKKVPVGATQLGCAFVQGKYPVSVGLNGQISLLPLPGSPGDQSKIPIITGHYAPVSDLAVDPAGGSFYTGDTNGILCKYDLKSTKPLARLEPSREGGNADLMYVVHGTTDRPAAISGVTVTKDGAVLSVGWDDQLYVTPKGSTVVNSDPTPLGAQPVCVATGGGVTCVVTVKGLLLVDSKGKVTTDKGIVEVPYEPKCAAVSPDGKIVYVGGGDCNVYAYSTGSGGSSLEQVGSIEGKHLKPVHAVALSGDGKRLASGDERDVCVFDVSDLRNVKALVGRGTWCFHLQRVTNLAFSPDGKVVASGGMDDSVYLWCLEKKMKRVHYPYAHRGGLTGLSFVADRELLSVGADSVVNRWDVSKDVKEKFDC